MARRVAYIKKEFGKISDLGLMHLDAGGFANLFTDAGTERTRAIIDIYDKLNLTAVNISARELADDADRFEELIVNSKVPYISANIVNEATGEPHFKTHIIVEQSKKRIGILGVTEQVIKTWKTSENVTLSVADPVEKLKPLVAKLEEKTDLIILLAHLPRRKLEPLIEAVPGIDIVLGADGYSTTNEILQIGNTYVSYPGRQGKNVGVLEFRITENGIADMNHRMVNLRKDMPEDPEIKTLVNATNARIAERQAAAEAELEKLFEQVNEEWTGYFACNNCHQEEVRIWRGTKHYSAHAGMFNGHRQPDDTCLTCHTTGYGQGGFVDMRANPRMVNVQCESCHGPGREHANDPDNVSMPVTPDEKTCHECHDQANSPEFEYSAYWAKIAH